VKSASKPFWIEPIADGDGEMRLAAPGLAVED
jgi:hypothetical protein